MRLAEPLRGSAFGLRSPQAGDAEFTVSLRSSPEVSRFLHRISGDLDSQRRWEAAAVSSTDSLPLVVFRSATDEPVGTASIYRVTEQSAEWGHWVIAPGSLAAVESVLLLLRIAFLHLSLETLRSRTLQRNVLVLSFHDRAGFARVAEGHLEVNGAAEVYVEHEVRADQFPDVERRLVPLAERIALRLR